MGGWSDGTADLVKDTNATLNLLHETIQTQIKATNRQSRVMFWLTICLVIFTVALVAIGFIQIKIDAKNVDSNSKINQTQADYKQPPFTKGTQVLPPTVKSRNIEDSGGDGSKESVNTKTSQDNTKQPKPKTVTRNTNKHEKSPQPPNKPNTADTKSRAAD